MGYKSIKKYLNAPINLWIVIVIIVISICINMLKLNSTETQTIESQQHALDRYQKQYEDNQQSISELKLLLAKCNVERLDTSLKFTDCMRSKPKPCPQFHSEQEIPEEQQIEEIPEIQEITE